MRGSFGFPWLEADSGLFLEAKPGDSRPKAFLTLLATVEEWLATELRGLPEEVSAKLESQREAASWPSEEGRSSSAMTTASLGGIISGGVESLLEWPNQRSLKR